MEEDNTSLSALSQEERIKLIKEERRKLHEERLKQSNLFFTNTDTTLSSKISTSDGNRSDIRPNFSGSSSSLDQQPRKTGVLRKPTIPHILRSATEPVTGAYDHLHDSSAFKKPSILKRKDDISCYANSSCNSATSTSTSSSNPASVSFGLSVSKSMLTRTKSIDSNLSGDTETGYWSGGENFCGILKGRRNNFDEDSSDQSPKLRRCSLGSSIVSSGSEGGLQSILKRKLSYDSSYIMKESNPSEYSFSTHSLPACGCLSPEPKKPILKKKSSSEDLEEMEPKPILKHRNFRDNHEFSLDNERIKPCLKKALKKSTSKSADECFTSSNADSSRYSSLFSETLSHHSNTNKGILKKGGILKNTWRESSSTSNSSSSSDIENLRSFHADDPSDNLRGRLFCNENLDTINVSSENNNGDSFLTTYTPDADVLTYAHSPDDRDRYDALSVENGLACNNQIGKFLVASTEESAKNSSTTSSHHGKVDCDVSVFGLRKKTLPVNTLPLPERNERKTSTEDYSTSPPFKLNWRRNSFGTTSQLHELLYGKSSEKQEEQDQNSRATQAETIHNMGSKIERTDSHEDIVMSLTVAEKRSLFMQLENECRQESIAAARRNAEKLKGAGRAKRYTTQPVTTDEVEKAAAMMVQNQDHENHDTTSLTKSTTRTEANPFVKPQRDDTNHEALKLPTSSTNFKETINLQRYQFKSSISQSLDSDNLINDQRSKGELDSDVFLTLTSQPELHDTSVNYHLPVTTKPPSGASFNRRRSSSTTTQPSKVTKDCRENGHVIEKNMDHPSKMEESSNLSFKDRIRMFNVLSSTVQSECQRRPTKRTVTSRRFATQPIKSSSSSHLQFEDCEWRSGASRVAVDTTDGASSSCMHKKTNVPTTPSGNKSTVRDEEGQINESECSKSMNTMSAISAKDVQPQVSTCAKVVNRCQDLISETAVQCKSTPEMPEKLLPVSDDLSISPNNQVNIDDADRDFDRITSSEEFSRNTRKLSKSSSATSMMMSPESELNLYQKSKVNRTSIADKIAALQTNGEITWKTRLTKLNPEKGKIVPTDPNDNVELRKNNKDSSVIASKLSQLTVSQDGWKKRVGGENDASIYTVEGRLEKAGKIVRNIEPEVPTSPTKGFKLRFQNRPTEAVESPVEDSDPVKTTAKKTSKQAFRPPDVTSSSESSEEEKVVRRVFQNDNDTFQNFFSDSLSLMDKPSISTPSVQIEESSFTAIQLENRKLLGLRKNVKAPRNHSHITNPVKSLAARLKSLDQTYLELNPEVREKELKRRIQMESLAKQTQNLSVEALAGLASKEDFTSVKLKKAASNQIHSRDYPHPMLIRIKGRFRVQTRLVPPESQSLSSGDNYILVTTDKLYQYIGEYSNRLERAKVADVVNLISKKRDLGISSKAEVVTIEEPFLSGSRDRNKFFSLLSGDTTPETNMNELGDKLDEEFEKAVISTNRLYEIDEAKEELIPLENENGWGSQPRYSILSDDKVLVFDFGSEMYVWSGSKADPFLKKTGFRLAKKLYTNSYNFTETGIIDAAFSPICGSLQGNQRPAWCWLKKINQHMEPITFSEKFFDWPDDSGRIIKVQQKKISDASPKDIGYNFKPCNVDEMIVQFSNVADPTLEVEGFNVGRGSTVHNSEEMQDFIITTLGVQAWTISEFSKCDVDLLGHFYSQETYVIRWQLSVTQIGRDLKGNKSKHSGKVLGRERCVYFFWQGKDSKITEQGTSALMTVELDQEKGPQIRVEQGREHPAFLSLFKGLMLIHLGLKETSVKDVKLYVTMGSCLSEGHFIEVAPEPSSFRSLGSFILIDFIKLRIYLWHGSLSNDVTRKIAAQGAAKFIESPKIYLNSERQFKLIELEEGEETQAFLRCFHPVPNSLKWAESYATLSGRALQDYAKVEVFAFSSLSGTFEAAPVFSPKRMTDSLEAFPFLQDQLYHYHQQPKLFLIARGPEVWIWQGWRPRGDEENENTSTGSGELRWAAERKAALETAVEFSRKRGTRGYLVFAGLEPPLFTNIFPYWSIHEEAREVHLGEGRIPNSTVAVEDALEKFLKTTYTLEELQDRPEGVDHSRLETYLEDFEAVMKMSKDEFVKLPTWKKVELKKAVGLF